MEPGAWPAATSSFQLLLYFVTDARPKIRKRACSSVIDVLAAAQTCPANLAAASEAVLACEAAGGQEGMSEGCCVFALLFDVCGHMYECVTCGPVECTRRVGRNERTRL